MFLCESYACPCGVAEAGMRPGVPVVLVGVGLLRAGLPWLGIGREAASGAQESEL